MDFNLCEECEKYKAKYKVYLSGVETIDLCGRCIRKKKYAEYECIPIDELDMDDEEQEGWEDIAEYYND
ncbi:MULTISPECIES: hypothetical protein [Clostridium]|uniref:Uncharacterized protein n=1 Tax=Clostridium lapidicellarium TaxID=3240931 RepID=A0ABV4DTS5_9CLOT